LHDLIPINEGVFIYSNTVQTMVTFPLLAVLKGGIDLFDIPALTYANLPKLTYIGEVIYICENNTTFRIPSAPPNAPSGGLKITGPSADLSTCFLKQGTGVCSGPTACP
jgi:hypothetical protein